MNAGQINMQGDELALFRTSMETQVLTHYNALNVTEGRHLVVSENGIKAYEFPVGAGVTSGYLERGQKVSDQNTSQNVVTVALDGILYAAFTYQDIDDLMTNVRWQDFYARQSAADMAAQNDKNVFAEIIKGALSVGTLTDGAATPTYINPGMQVTADFKNAIRATAAEALLQGIQDAAQKCQENNIPDSTPKYLALKPKYFALLKDKANNWVMSRDYAGSGNIATGQLPNIEGFEILVSNNVPDTNVIGKHAVDASKVGACFWIPQAVGTLRARDITLEIMRRPDYQDNLFITTCVSGHSYLSPEYCGVIKTA